MFLGARQGRGHLINIASVAGHKVSMGGAVYCATKHAVRALSEGIRQEVEGIVPIPGTTKLHRLEENLGAAAVLLTAEELRQIEEALAHIQVQGARYPAHLAARVGK